MSSSPPVLDHCSVPHIIHRIVQLAPSASLLRLRAVSRALRKRADAVLMSDDFILTDNTSDGETTSTHPTVVVSAPDSRIPSFAEWATAYPGDLPRWNDESAFDGTGIRVLDVVGRVGFNHVNRILEKIEPHTLRILPGQRDNTSAIDVFSGRPQPKFVRGSGKLYDPAYYLCSTVTTIVRFAPLHLVVFSEASIYPPAQPVTEIYYVFLHPDDGVKTAAPLDHWWGPQRTSLVFQTSRPPVIIFHRTSKPCQEVHDDRHLHHFNFPGHHATSIDATQMLDELMARLLAPYLVDKHSFAFTIVGLEAVADWLERSMVGNSPETKFINKLADIERVQLLMGFDRQEVIETLSKVMRFRSLEEYRAEIGPERAALETMM